MSEPFLGEIRILPFNFAPRGWAFCQGQLMAIAQNTALFSLLGTTYGGNGQTTFALPDLRGRVAISSGQGPGLSPFTLGQVGGEEIHALTANEMPSHTHAANGTASAGAFKNPTGKVWAANDDASNYASTPTAALAPAAIGNAGGSQPHNNREPYLALNFCIALEGIYPSRN